jgi:hypothetical protein
MMNKKMLVAFCFLVAVLSQVSFAQISPLNSDVGNSYYYIDHYEVAIEKPTSDVWPFIIDMGAWMPGLKEANESSPTAVEGEVFRLYGNFHMEVVKVIPEKMLLLVNLPNIQEGEKTQGTAMITVSEENGKTLVSLIMNRIHLWPKSEKNILRERRESSVHVNNRKSMYKQGFLARLKKLSEGTE